MRVDYWTGPAGITRVRRAGTGTDYSRAAWTVAGTPGAWSDWQPLPTGRRAQPWRQSLGKLQATRARAGEDL